MVAYLKFGGNLTCTMSYSSTNELAPGTKFKDVAELVTLMRYRYTGALKSEEVGLISCFSWFEEKDYQSWTGVELGIYEDESKVTVETSTPVARSYFDLEHQNKTIRLIRKHFGGTFTTDEGSGRYLRPSSRPPVPAASGCHLAFQRFGSNLIRLMCTTCVATAREPSRRDRRVYRFDSGAGFQAADHLCGFIGLGVGDGIGIGTPSPVRAALQRACAFVDIRGWRRICASSNGWQISHRKCNEKIFHFSALWG